MISVHDADNVLLVDLFATIDSYRFSVRDALLYLEYANVCMIPEIESSVQRLHHSKHKLQKHDHQLHFHPHSLKRGDMVEVKVVQITTPHLFYVMKVQ